MLDSTSSYYNSNTGITSVNTRNTILALDREEVRDIVGNFGGNNPYTRVRTKSQEDMAVLVINNPTTHDTSTIEGNVTQYMLMGTGKIQDTFYSVDVDLDKAIKLAKLNCLANINKSPYAFGEDLAELHQSFDFLNNTRGQIQELEHKFAKSIKKFYRSKGLSDVGSGTKRLVNATSKAFLTVNFGYANIIRSTLNAMRAYEERDRVRAVQSSAYAKEDVSDVKSGIFKRKWGSNYDQYFTSVGRAVRVRAVVLYHDKSPLEGWRFDIGLRNQDLVKTAWQVMPASWFIDSFLNVSSALEAAFNVNDPSIVIDRAWVSYTDSSSEATSYTTSSNVGWSYSGSGAVFSRETDLKVRRPWTPSIVDAIPQPVLPQHATSILNDAAYGLMKLSGIRSLKYTT
jgi:hypothetical protein